MMNCLSCELKRAFKNRRLFCTVFFGCALTAVQYFLDVLPVVAYLNDYQTDPGLLPHSVFSQWIGANGASPSMAVYITVAPILAAFPYGDSFLSDRQSGYMQTLLLSSSRMKFLLSKYIAVFLSGGFCGIFPLVFNLLLTIATLPSISPVAAMGVFAPSSSSMFGDLFFIHPWGYLLLFFFLEFLFFGALSTVALLVSFFLTNSFLVTTLPFILYFMFSEIVALFGSPQIAPTNFLFPDQVVQYCSSAFVLSVCILFPPISCLAFLLMGRKLETIS